MTVIHFVNVYISHFFPETLRKYPPIPFITRKCLLDYKVPNTDLILEVGTDVLIPIKAIHYDGSIYENPEKFNPDRFSSEQKQSRHQYAHIPFGEGPRNCIGIFPLNNIVYRIMRILFYEKQMTFLKYPIPTILS